MDGLGVEGILRNSGLKSSVKEFIQGQSQNVIELELFGGEETITMHSSEEGSTFEKPSRVFFFKGEELSGCLSELRESEMDSPDFTLILEAILSDKL